MVMVNSHELEERKRKQHFEGLEGSKQKIIIFCIILVFLMHVARAGALGDSSPQRHEHTAARSLLPFQPLAIPNGKAS